MMTKKDIVKIEIPKALKEIADLFAELFTKYASFQNRYDLPSRTPQERLKNRESGNLATYSVAYYLIQKGKYVRVYDFERNDFSSPDPWDLKVISRDGKELTVEVKSSGPAKNTTDLDTVLTKRTLAVKPGEQKDVNIMVYHLPKDYGKSLYIISWATKVDLDKLESKGKVESFGIDKQRLRFSPKLKEYRPISELLNILR